VRWSNSKLADEIYELLLHNSEAANSLPLPVSTAPHIEQQLSRYHLDVRKIFPFL